MKQLTISEVQTLLLRRNLYTGKVDGIQGPKMKAALLAFQKMKGLKQTGGITGEVQAALQAIAPLPTDRSPFYREVREDLGILKQSQVLGFEAIFAAWIQSGLTDLRWFAYMLATAWHETARTMEPVTEYGGLKYLKSKKYWPFVGRGYVQLTWQANYEKYGISDTPERALDPDFAAHIMIDGMTQGIFTSKKLSDYFNAKTDSPTAARKIINGTDKQFIIAGYHRTFLSALKAIEPTLKLT